ncbi:MAG: alpha/beta hydrolase [Bacteroidia bacterium]|nr:alpha/beta hydrolase [Bacteroidia bacterium]
MKQVLILGVVLQLLSIPYVSCQTSPSSGLREIPDLLYVQNPEVDSLQRLNLVLPDGVDQPPLLIWIGGGAWSYVDRKVEMDFARQMAHAGIAMASVGHRLSPAIWRDSSLNTGIQHPKHIEDIAAAVKWLLDHASSYGYDPDNIFIGGFSSGAQLATLLCVDGQYLAAHGLSTDLFQGIIPISGTYDIVNYHEIFLNSERPEMAQLHVEAVFGEAESDWIEASPTSFLDSLHTPMLLMVDRYLTNYTRLFEEKLLEADFHDFQVLYIHDLSHGQLWRDFSHNEQSIYRQLLIDFILAHSQDTGIDP